MSTRVPEGVEAVRVDEVVEPLLERSRQLAISRRTARLLASFGRFGVILLPVYALSSRWIDGFATALVVAFAVSAVWAFAVRSAFAAARPILLPLGPGVAAALGTATGFVPVCALALVLPKTLFQPVVALEMAGAVFVLSAAWESIVYRSDAIRQRVLVVGAADGGAELVEDLELAAGSPFELVGIVDDERESDQIAGVPLRGRVADLAQTVEEQRPDIVVLASGHSRPDAFDQLLDVAWLGFKVVGLPEFYEHAFGRVPVRHLSAQWFMGVLHLYQRPYTRFAKRAFDLVVGSIGLLLTAPLFPIVALVVRRTSGPIIFRQVRMGEGGEPFTIYKFRTMRVDAEADGRAIWASEHDPRIAPGGHFLRRTRLDELPQLWNVLRGDMSIVGPRPERPEFVDELRAAVPFWARRHLVKPGITGWAQVCRGYTADTQGTSEKLSFDLWYLRHRSLLVDLAVCVKTFSTLVTGSGAR